MTSNQGGGTHPGDPWSPDWKPATPESTSEEEWPYDESLTLSDAELEIAGLDDEDDESVEESDVDASEAGAEEPEEAAVSDELDDLVAAVEAEEAAAEEPEEAVDSDELDDLVAAVEAEEAAAEEPEEAAVSDELDDLVAAVEAEELAAREAAAKEAEEAAAKEAAAKEAAELAAREAAAKEAEEAAAKEAEEAAAKEAEELAAKEAAELAAKEAEEAAAKEAEEAAAKEAEELAAREAEEAAAKEAEEAAAKEAEELAAREAAELEAEELAAREAAELAAKEAEEAAAKEAEELAAKEAEEAAAREAEELAAKEAEEAAAREAEELAAKEAEEAAAREAEEAAAMEAAAKQAEEAAESARGEDEVVLRAVAEAPGEEAPEQVDVAPIEEVALEDLQAEPEWLEAVEEMTLDDIAEAGEVPAAGEPESVVAAVSAEPEEDHADEPEMATAVIDSIAATDADAASDDIGEVVVEDATFEVVDLDDEELRADTAEHMFEVLDFEEEDGDAAIAHDEITAEVPVTAAPAVDVADPPPVPDIEFEVPPEYGLVADDVDATRDALAAFMALPAPADLADVEADAGIDDEPELEELAEDEAAGETAAEEAAPLVEGQLQIPNAVAEPISMAEASEEPEPEPEPEPEREPEPLTPEQELVARLSGDLTLPDFETFVQEDFARDFAPEPTQEHLVLAEDVSSAEEPELSALTATMPGVDHGHVGFQDLDEALHFDDPDAPDEEPSEEISVEAEAEAHSSDLTLRVASAVILVALLAGTLWAGGVTFLLFITVIALAAQIEFYAALRAGGYRPLVLFGLFGGLGALVGTYVQGSDVLREGPIAIAAALGLTVVATFAWYGAQETPPRHPWRNGMATILGVAWIPALLALVLPMAELPRSDRFPIIIALLLAVAAFDVGSYFVGRALGSRKLSPVLSPNKTVEGLIGGVIATVIIALLSAAVVDAFDVGTALAVAVGVIIASPLGDLAESLVKRSLDIKDMGQLIPGHGGVLDRIDSYLFAVPIAYLVLRWTGLL